VLLPTTTPAKGRRTTVPYTATVFGLVRASVPPC
jgi:hypothetical protein